MMLPSAADLGAPAGPDDRGRLAFLDDGGTVEPTARAERRALVDGRVDGAPPRPNTTGRVDDGVGDRSAGGWHHAGVDALGVGHHGEPPRDDLDADVGDRQSVDAAVLGLEGGEHAGVVGRNRRRRSPTQTVTSLPCPE